MLSWGQTRRGWIVTCELPYSRAFVGALIFSKEFPDVAFGMARCLARLGALPDKLVWDREGAIAPRGRPTEDFLAFCGRLALGWIILDGATARPRGRSSARTASCTFPVGEARWLTVVSPEDPDRTELLLEPDGHPAAKGVRAGAGR